MMQEAIRLWREKPDVMVRQLFGVEPDPWQLDVLQAFPHRPYIAMKACKGPGKTCLLAWLAWNFLLTRDAPKIAATAISGEQLRDNLWSEMAKWQNRSELLKALFEWRAERITCRANPQEWWMSARRWSKSADPASQANTLAGLHADYIMFLLDESGGIPESVMVAAEAALSSCVEGHIVQAGNPTDLAGPLYNACTRDRSKYYVVEISGDPDDPKRSPRVSVEWAREQIEAYGRDNPWVLVNVFGKFPPSAFNALLGPDDIREAQERHYREDVYGNMPCVLGVDVAREGSDRSVIFPRQGLVAWMPRIFRNLDSLQGAGQVSLAWNEHNADACFIDNTGGFGAGWIDQLSVLNRAPIGVHFSERATQADRYYNRRTEMHFQAAEWVKAGGHLPPVPELVREGSAPLYAFKGDKMIIEDKEQIRQRLQFSPDLWDAFILTHAMPVFKASHERQLPQRSLVDDYDPFG